MSNTDQDGAQGAGGRPKTKLTPPQALIVAFVFAAVSIWMIVDPSVSTSRWHGPKSLAACRAMGAVGLVVCSWLILRLTQMLLHDRWDGKSSGGNE
jgi:hypothetical protein